MKRFDESQLSFDGGQTAADLSYDLASQGYSLIEHEASEEVVDALIRDYAVFTDELPDPDFSTLDAMMYPGTDPKELDDNLDVLDRSADKQKEWHKYRTNYESYAKPGGYTNRSLQVRMLQEVRGVTLSDDPKEYFHYHPYSMERIEANHRRYDWGPIPPEVKTLHMRFSIIHSLAVTATQAVYRKLELEHPELMNRFARLPDQAGSPIRLLFYHPGQGDLLAGGHYDKGLGTMQVAESHLGFRARVPGTSSDEQIAAYQADPLNDPNMQLLKRDPKYGIFFTAASWVKDNVYPDSPLRPTWHDVINLPELNQGRQLHGRNCARWAIIFFTNSQATGKPLTKADTHSEMVIDLSASTIDLRDRQNEEVA